MPMKIGLKKLDSRLRGMPSESSILLLGPPKSGKTIFGIHFLFEGLSNNGYGIFIITNNFPEEVVKRFEKIGKIEKFLDKGLLRFVDCYSIHAGVGKKSTIFIIRVNGPTALTEISLALSKIFKQIPNGSKARVVCDSLSTLLLYNPPDQIATLVQQLNGKAKSSGAASLYVLEEGMHDKKVVTTLDSLMDVMIHLKREKSKNLIEVIRDDIRKSVVFRIKNGKIKCS